MRFGKTKMFFYFNGLIFLGLLFYFLPWAFSSTTTGNVVIPFEPNAVHVQYEVKGKEYYGTYMRNGIKYRQSTVSIRYLKFSPDTSRVNSFLGMFAEPLAWWGVLLVASAMLLLTPNGVFARGTVFELHKKFPWISMEEYFPVQGYWQSGEPHETPPPQREKKPPAGEKHLPG